MKNLLLSLFLVCSVAMLLSAQVKNIDPNLSKNASTQLDDSSKNKYTFQYLVGSPKVDGYSMQINTYTTTSSKEAKAFKNGKSAPILQVYVNNKSKYIGGVLEDNKGNKTTITNIKLERKTSTSTFTVLGKDFSMSFELSNGAILKEEANVTVFYTDNVGVWKMFKKQ